MDSQTSAAVPRPFSFFLTLLISLLAGICPLSAMLRPPSVAGPNPNGHYEEPGNLLHEGFRYRDRSTATFLTRDPAGFIDGPNDYNYVRHNPWSAWDPNGLATSFIPNGTNDIGYVTFSDDPSAPSITTNPGAGLPDWTGAGYPSVPDLSDLLLDYDVIAAIVGSHVLPQAPIGPQPGDLDSPKLPPIDENSPGARAASTLKGVFEFPARAAVWAFNTAMGTDITSAPLEFHGYDRGISIGEEHPTSERLVNLGFVLIPELGAAGRSFRIGERSVTRLLVDDAVGEIGYATKVPLPKCFAAGTDVETPDGEKDIENIKKGDTVCAYDFETGTVVERRVLETVTNFTHYWADVEVAGDVLHATRGHKFWVESSHDWIEAAELKPGMVVRLSGGSFATVATVSVRALTTPETTYNLIVEGEHNYFVGDHHVLIHNGYPESPQYPQPTQVGETFQFNFDTSPNMRNSRAAGVREARALGLLGEGGIGHHINSVKTHPHLAAEPSNIAAEASRATHLKIHGGSWRNPTTGPLNGACP